MYMLASLGHLGRAAAVREVLARFGGQGRTIDFSAGVAREPYVDGTTRDLLASGLEKAMAFARA
jgi:hypothetical protein